MPTYFVIYFHGVIKKLWFAINTLMHCFSKRILKNAPYKCVKDFGLDMNDVFSIEQDAAMI